MMPWGLPSASRKRRQPGRMRSNSASISVPTSSANSRVPTKSRAPIAVCLLEVRDDIIIVVEDHVTVYQDRNAGLAGDGLHLGALGVRARNVDRLVIEQQVGQLLAYARAIRAPFGLIEHDVGRLSHRVSFRYLA